MPEEQIDVTVKMQVPEVDGKHISIWSLVNEKEEKFGELMAEVVVDGEGEEASL